MSKIRTNSINIVNQIDFAGWFAIRGETPTPEAIQAVAVPLIAHFEVELQNHKIDYAESQLQSVNAYVESVKTTLDVEEMKKVYLLQWFAQQSVRLHKARLGLI